MRAAGTVLPRDAEDAKLSTQSWLRVKMFISCSYAHPSLALFHGLRLDMDMSLPSVAPCCLFSHSSGASPRGLCAVFAALRPACTLPCTRL
jgi:hypothetical protein